MMKEIRVNLPTNVVPEPIQNFLLKHKGWTRNLCCYFFIILYIIMANIPAGKQRQLFCLLEKLFELDILDSFACSFFFEI